MVIFSAPFRAGFGAVKPHGRKAKSIPMKTTGLDARRVLAFGQTNTVRAVRFAAHKAGDEVKRRACRRRRELHHSE